MKYEAVILMVLFSFISVAQSEVVGKIKTEIIAQKELAYVFHIPINTNEKKPLIIFLHGSVEKGIYIIKSKSTRPFQVFKKL